MPRYKKRFCSPSSCLVAPALLAALLGSAAGTVGAAAQSPPPAEQIKAQLIDNFLQDQQALQLYVHREHVTTEKDGAREGHTLRVWYVLGHEINKTIALDDRPISAGELAAGQESAVKHAAEAAQKPPAKTGMLVFSGHEYPFSKLANDFVYGPAAVRRWDGRTVWVYPASPNPHAESRSREEKLLLHTAGEVWVDAADLHIIRISMHLTSPVKYGFGVLATVRGANLNLVLERHSAGEWLPQEADFSVLATVLLVKTISRAKRTTYSDYQPDDQADDQPDDKMEAR